MNKRNRIHVSWLIAWSSLGILIGTYLSLYTTRFSGLEYLFMAFCLSVVSLIRKDYIAVILMIIVGLLVGLWRGGNQVLSQRGFESYYNKEVVLSGKVRDDPSLDSEGDLRFILVDVVVDNHNQSGTVWVATNTDLQIKRSDNIEVQGKLTKGFGTIPAAIFKARVQMIERQDFVDVGRETRDWFASGIRRSIIEPEASLGTGFLLGQKTELPEKLDQELRLLGLTHIVVASGYNLTILVRFARRFFSKISRFSALSLSGFLIFGFAQLTGFSPSMVRASLITSLSLLAWYYGRKIHPLVLLPFSAAVTVVINPVYAWGDIGWLLSFASFVGVIMLSPLIHSYFWGDKKPNSIRQVFIETMSAQILALPIIIFVFNQYSPLSLLANVLILPLIPIAMALIMFAGIGGLSLGSLAVFVGKPAEIILRYMTTIVDKLAVLPKAQSEINITINTLIIGYIAIFTGMIYLWRRTGLEFREYNIIE
ncbi:MAG: ComEC/Rec2 family competence protein [Candidatus Saccharibacteria bacterium]|nr:ComEC/Rec2 family competence protein [Candidatus Saccharibacteria bacterium]